MKNAVTPAVKSAAADANEHLRSVPPDNKRKPHARIIDTAVCAVVPCRQAETVVQDYGPMKIEAVGDAP